MMLTISDLTSFIDSQKKEVGKGFDYLAEFISFPIETTKKNWAQKREGEASQVEDIGIQMGLRESENALRAPPIDQTGSPLDMYGGMGKAAILAYQGSPYKFLKHEWDKIRAGTGGTMQGKGHYFAEREPTARYYSHVTRRVQVVDPEGHTVNFSRYTDSPEALAAKYLADTFNVGDPATRFERASQRLKNEIAQHGSYVYQRAYKNKLLDALDFVEEWKSKGYRITDDSHLYKVELKWPDPKREAEDPLRKEHFLNWDAPMSSELQPESIRQVPMEGLRAERYKMNPNIEHPANYNWMVRDKEGKYVSYPGTVQPVFGRSEEEVLSRLNANNTGKVFYKNLLEDAFTLSEENVIKHLKSKGIPGQMYLDSLSRPQGYLDPLASHNFVVNSDDLITILEHQIVRPSRNR